MKNLYQNATITPRKRLVRMLTIMMTVTFVGAILLSTLYSCLTSSGYQEVVDLSEVELVQLEAPEAGDPIAVVSTSLGDISFVLYPEEAPNAVANFQRLADSGYYDNTYIYRVEEGAFFAAGSKKKDGLIADSSVETEHVPRELSENLWPFRGALCSLNTGAEGGFFDRFLGNVEYFNGSRFTVVNTVALSEEEISTLKTDTEGNKVADAFIEHGGVPNFSRQMTVFGQAYDGLDVLDTITAVALEGTDEAHYPKEDIFILTVTTGTYSTENSTVSTEFSTDKIADSSAD